MALIGVNTIAVCSALSVASGGGTATTSTFPNATSGPNTGIGQGKNLSLFYQVTGAGGTIKIEWLASFDATNFCIPDTGGIIATGVTDANLHCAVIQVPVCKQFQLKVTNTGGSTVTVACTVLSQ